MAGVRNRLSVVTQTLKSGLKSSHLILCRTEQPLGQVPLAARESSSTGPGVCALA